MVPPSVFFGGCSGVQMNIREISSLQAMRVPHLQHQMSNYASITPTSQGNYGSENIHYSPSRYV